MTDGLGFGQGPVGGGFPDILLGLDHDLIEDGRLYRGEEAKTMGLVDELGNLQAAIEGARYLASR